MSSSTTIMLTVISLLNPDTLVLRGALDKLLAFAKEKPQAGIWGGRTLYADGSLNPFSCWRRLDLWALAMRATGLVSLFRESPIFNAEAYGGWRRDTVRGVDIVTGCLFLTSRRADWLRLGGFDPTFVMYGDEADLCRRAQAIGARPMITPEAEIVHYAGASETVRAEKQNPALPGAGDAGPPAFPALAAAAGAEPAPRGAAQPDPQPSACSGRSASAARRTGRPGLQRWRRRAEWWDGYPDRSRS